MAPRSVGGGSANVNRGRVRDGCMAVLGSMEPAGVRGPLATLARHFGGTRCCLSGFTSPNPQANFGLFQTKSGYVEVRTERSICES
jgi:hypothetical protein